MLTALQMRVAAEQQSSHGKQHSLCGHGLRVTQEWQGAQSGLMDQDAEEGEQKQSLGECLGVREW